MNLNDYISLIIKQQEYINENTKDAILEQNRLHDIAVEKANKRYEIEDKSNALIKKGTEKFLKLYPQYKNLLNDNSPKIERMKQIASDAINQTDLYVEITKKMKNIEEFVENENLLNELSKVTFEYFDALANLNKKINEDRKSFFSKEYLEKMDNLADEGILLYFLETPDFPLLEKEFDMRFLLDSLLFNNGLSLKTLLYAFFSIDSPSSSMKRKQEDLFISVELLLTNYNRSAARNIFALLDSEHKKVAEAFEGFYEKEKIYKNGMQRATKIDSIVQKIDLDWINKAWDKVNCYYKKIVGSTPTKGVIHRNSIVHGDYYESRMDITQHDVLKLILLWLNLRLIADYVCNLEDLYNNIITMLPDILKLLEKN